MRSIFAHANKRSKLCEETPDLARSAQIDRAGSQEKPSDAPGKLDTAGLVTEEQAQGLSVGLHEVHDIPAAAAAGPASGSLSPSSTSYSSGQAMDGTAAWGTSRPPADESEAAAMPTAGPAKPRRNSLSVEVLTARGRRASTRLKKLLGPAGVVSADTESKVSHLCESGMPPLYERPTGVASRVHGEHDLLALSLARRKARRSSSRGTALSQAGKAADSDAAVGAGDEQQERYSQSWWIVLPERALISIVLPAGELVGFFCRYRPHATSAEPALPETPTHETSGGVLQQALRFRWLGGGQAAQPQGSAGSAGPAHAKARPSAAPVDSAVRFVSVRSVHVSSAEAASVAAAFYTQRAVLDYADVNVATLRHAQKLARVVTAQFEASPFDDGRALHVSDVVVEPDVAVHSLLADFARASARNENLFKVELRAIAEARARAAGPDAGVGERRRDTSPHDRAADTKGDDAAGSTAAIARPLALSAASRAHSLAQLQNAKDSVQVALHQTEESRTTDGIERRARLTEPELREATLWRGKRGRARQRIAWALQLTMLLGMVLTILLFSVSTSWLVADGVWAAFLPAWGGGLVFRVCIEEPAFLLIKFGFQLALARLRLGLSDEWAELLSDRVLLAPIRLYVAPLVAIVLPS